MSKVEMVREYVENNPGAMVNGLWVRDLLEEIDRLREREGAGWERAKEEARRVLNNGRERRKFKEALERIVYQAEHNDLFEAYQQMHETALAAIGEERST